MMGQVFHVWRQRYAVECVAQIDYKGGQNDDEESGAAGDQSRGDELGGSGEDQGRQYYVMQLIQGLERFVVQGWDVAGDCNRAEYDAEGNRADDQGDRGAQAADELAAAAPHLLLGGGGHGQLRAPYKRAPRKLNE